MAGKLIIAKEQQMILNSIVQNTTMYRQDLYNRIFGDRTSLRNMDRECGYPEAIDVTHFKLMAARKGVAQRVNSAYPDECWVVHPSIVETKDQNEDTPFEEAFADLEERYSIFHYLHRIDVQSGLGRYGLLLLGIDDGKDLKEPVIGVTEDPNIVPAAGKNKYKLAYLRVFDESLVKIKSYETNTSSPRYGKPLLYTVTTIDPSEPAVPAVNKSLDIVVHWSRVIHVADNRSSSEIFGQPRLQPVYNYLLDLKKILGGSAEMFYKGGFPGIAFEVDPKLAASGTLPMDKEKMKKEFFRYAEGLQRYLALQGVTAKSLAPQVADPSKHIESQLGAIAITIDMPLRILIGSEQAQLASAQDARSWNKRLWRRQNNYLTPLVIRPFLNRLIMMGILPAPKKFFVIWDDLNAPSDLDKSTVAMNKVNALSQYVSTGVEAIVPPQEFLTIVMGMSPEEARQVLKNADSNMMTMMGPMGQIQATMDTTRMKIGAKTTGAAPGKGSFGNKPNGKTPQKRPSRRAFNPGSNPDDHRPKLKKSK